MDFSNWKPWQLVVVSAITVYVIMRLCRRLHFAIRYNNGLIPTITRLVWNLLKKIPLVKNKVAHEFAGVKELLANSFLKQIIRPDKPVIRTLPSKGLTQEEIHSEMHEFRKNDDSNWQSASGQIRSGYVYVRQDVMKLTSEVMALFAYSNQLHSDVFPNVVRMESEVCSMVLSLFNGPETACASLTTGGTESILMAVKAHRDWARDKKNITEPEMIVPQAAHPAFDKAGNFFGVRVIRVPSKLDYTADVAQMKKRINSNTILLVGSAPGYPHGYIDSITELGQIALENGIGCHSDCCLGGLYHAFLDGPKCFDFRIPGVTSISCDTHKYGQAVKGSSVVMYRTRELRGYQFSFNMTWQGGMYISPTIAGSRVGACVAATWAALMHIGYDGYRDVAISIRDAVRYIKDHVPQGLETVGDPDGPVVAFTSSVDVNSHLVARCMSNKGWHLDYLQNPTAIHFCVVPLHMSMKDMAQRFIHDLVNLLNLYWRILKAALGDLLPYVVPQLISPILHFLMTLPLSTRIWWQI